MATTTTIPGRQQTRSVSPFNRPRWAPPRRMAPMASRSLGAADATAEFVKAGGDFIWGVGGAGVGLASSTVLKAFFPEVPFLVGPFGSAFVGYMALSASRYKSRAIPWAVGALVPAAAYMIWGMFASRP